MARSRKASVCYCRTVPYNCGSTFSILLQRFGAVGPKVLPHCLANLAITAVVLYLLLVHQIDLTITEFGHEFMSLLIAFLVVNKCTTTMNIYFEFRESLSQLYQASVEIVQLAVAFTGSDDQSKRWRSNVAYHVIKLLQSTAAMMTQANTDGINSWQVLNSGDNDNNFDEKMIRQHFDPSSFDTITSKMAEDNLRTPIRLAHQLRCAIASHRTELMIPLDVIQEQQILQCVKAFMTGYYGIHKYATTPLPFAMVQMARIFLFAYVYTLPFALLSVDNSQPLQMTVLILIATYGYIGVECICVELDDPFGDDPHDLPVNSDVKGVAEDIYWSIYERDGLEAANSLMNQCRNDLPDDQKKAATTNGGCSNETSHLLP